MPSTMRYPCPCEAREDSIGQMVCRTCWSDWYCCDCPPPGRHHRTCEYAPVLCAFLPFLTELGWMIRHRIEEAGYEAYCDEGGVSGWHCYEAEWDRAALLTAWLSGPGLIHAVRHGSYGLAPGEEDWHPADSDLPIEWPDINFDDAPNGFVAIALAVNGDPEPPF